MKTLFTLSFFIACSIAITAQNIDNKLGTNGQFLITNENADFILSAERPSNGSANVTIGESAGPGATRELNIVKEGGSAGMTITSYYSNAFTSRSRIDFYQANGTYQSPQPLTQDEEIGFIDFYGRGTNDFDLGAAIKVLVDGTVGTTVPMRIELAIDNTPRLTVKSNGEVDFEEKATFKKGAVVDVGGITVDAGDVVLKNGSVSVTGNLFVSGQVDLTGVPTSGGTHYLLIDNAGVVSKGNALPPPTQLTNRQELVEKIAGLETENSLLKERLEKLEAIVEKLTK